jgi:DHA1 family inner membrane transport protein
MFAGYTYIAAFLAAVTGFDGAIIAWLLLGFGLAGALGNWIAGRVVDRDPLAATASVAAALAFAMAAVGLAGGSLPAFLLIAGMWGAAHMAAFVVCQVSAMAAGREAPAFAMSLNISVCNLGIALGAALGGLIVARYGVEATGFGAAALAAAALLIALTMMAARFGSVRRSRERPFLYRAAGVISCRDPPN